MSLHPIEITTLDGKKTTLGEYAGDVLLVVNVASKCGYTPQYAGLEELHQQYKDQGFTVLGFPCNQFLFQEPGGADSITTCSLNYGVTFPIMDKVKVRGLKKHPLYKKLTKAKTSKGKGGLVRWNFEKFLVSRDGEVIGRFRTVVEPSAPELKSAIEAALKA